jgi:hypothetical protein
MRGCPFLSCVPRGWACVADGRNSGCDPLTPEDIAEVVVFVATRRENVVVADTLVYPSHQASTSWYVCENGVLLTVGLGRGWRVASQVVMERFCGRGPRGGSRRCPEICDAKYQMVIDKLSFLPQDIFRARK